MRAELDLRGVSSFSLPAALGSVRCVVFVPNSAEMEHSAASGRIYGVLRMECVG